MKKKKLVNKKILIIATAFPPTGGSGALRTTKFVKYLPVYGWQSYVLTLKTQYFSRIDHELMSDIPYDVFVSRTRMFQFLDYLRKFYGKIKRNVSVDEGRVSGDWVESDNQKKGTQDFSKSVNQSIKNWLMFPDKYMGWIPIALYQGCRLCKWNNIPIIYTTSPPVTVQLIGFYLKKLTGTYWIVDFRDPWDIDYTHKNSSLRRQKQEEQFRNKILLNADRIIVNTHEAAEKLTGSNPEISRDKVCIITNGYDPMDFEFLNVYPNRDKHCIVISHVGELYCDGRRPDMFLKSLSELIEEGKLIDKNIKVRFIGDENYAYSREFQSLINRLKLDTIVEIYGFVSHSNSILKLMESDLLLLLQTGKRFELQIPAKVYEYMATGKPIFSLSPPGATTNLMMKYPLGFNADPEDQQNIKKELTRFFEGEYSLDINVQDFVKQFDRKTLTGQLADVLNRMDLNHEY